MDAFQVVNDLGYCGLEKIYVRGGPDKLESSMLSSHGFANALFDLKVTTGFLICEGHSHRRFSMF